VKLTANDIPRVAKAAEDFVANHHKGQEIGESVLRMGSGDETLCLLTPDELDGNSTICGTGANACFSGQVIAFLKDYGVEHVLVGVITEGEDEEDDLAIAGGAVPISYEGVYTNWKKWFPNGDSYLQECENEGDDISDSMVLSMLVANNDGSWRDDCCVTGWSAYESE
jgi:hypothetical protein